MADYGVTPAGFEVKPFARILEDHAARARDMFGPDADLRSTSALRKILDIASFGSHELWKALERQFYASFQSTASGDALDLLGEDLGVARRFLNARGRVTLTLALAAPGRTYHVPVGTVLETDAPVRRYRTLERAELSEERKVADVAVEAAERGPAGNVGASAIVRVNAFFAQQLRLGGATLTPANPAPVAGGEVLESDDSYRGLLLGYPRTVWTLEAVRAAVKAVDGVRDCRLLDPAGGVDVSLSRFKGFAFSQRRFGSQRFFGSPYRFDILVATHVGHAWESGGGVRGVREAVEDAVRGVRPVSVFPNTRRANHVQVGLRARIRVAPGHDRNGVVAALKDRLDARINGLGLGRAVLYSEVVLDVMGVAGVLDVTQLRLRRFPALLNRVNFGRRGRFRSEAVEAPVGESLELELDEIAEFRVDDELLEVEVTDR
jgi:uncharacterized phage protein gp47/JayE